MSRPLGSLRRERVRDGELVAGCLRADKFNARVAANVLGIVEREQALNPALQALDREAAKRWLPDRESTEGIPQQLALALAARNIPADPDFMEYLKARQLLVTAINNPRCASRSRRGTVGLNGPEMLHHTDAP